MNGGPAQSDEISSSTTGGGVLRLNSRSVKNGTRKIPTRPIIATTIAKYPVINGVERNIDVDVAMMIPPLATDGNIVLRIRVRLFYYVVRLLS